MDNSLIDILVIAGAVLISVVSAIGKARKKAADKQSEAKSENMAETIQDPIPNPWQEIFNLPAEEEDFIPKNPEVAPAVSSPKLERQPLIKPGVDYEPRDFREEMSVIKAKEREQRNSYSKYKANRSAEGLEVVNLSAEIEDETQFIDLELDQTNAWRKVVIYRELLEPKF